MLLPKELESLVLDYFWSRIHYADKMELNRELELLYIIAEAKSAYSYCLFENTRGRQTILSDS